MKLTIANVFGAGILVFLVVLILFLFANAPAVHSNAQIECLEKASLLFNESEKTDAMYRICMRAFGYDIP